MKLDAQLVIETAAALFAEKFGAACERGKTFPWLQWEGKPIAAACWFGPPVNCLFEFDSADRFSRERLRELDSYPPDAPLGFDVPLYRRLCAASRRKSGTAARQQARRDTALDLLPPRHGLNPTLRIAEAELRARLRGRLTRPQVQIAVRELLAQRFDLRAGTTFLNLLEHPSGKPFVPRLMGSP